MDYQFSSPHQVTSKTFSNQNQIKRYPIWSFFLGLLTLALNWTVIEAGESIVKATILSDRTSHKNILNSSSLLCSFLISSFNEEFSWKEIENWKKGEKKKEEEFDRGRKRLFWLKRERKKFSEHFSFYFFFIGTDRILFSDKEIDSFHYWDNLWNFDWLMLLQEKSKAVLIGWSSLAPISINGMASVPY